MQRAHEVDEAEAEHHGDDTHDDTHLGHLVLLHVTSGEGQGVRRCRDGQDHSTGSCNGHTDEYGGGTANGVEFVTHSTTDNGQNRHEECCCCRVRDKVREQVADSTAEQQDEQGRELAEGDTFYSVGS